MGTAHKTAMESDHGEFDLRLVHNFQMFASLKNEVGCSKLCVCYCQHQTHRETI